MFRTYLVAFVVLMAISKSRKETTEDRKVLGGCTECFVSGNGVDRCSFVTDAQCVFCEEGTAVVYSLSIIIIMHRFK
jgi:hypothetical protein